MLHATSLQSHKTLLGLANHTGVEVGEIPIMLDFVMENLLHQCDTANPKHSLPNFSDDEFGCVDIGDFPMSILTRGATHDDPAVEVSPHVHIIRPSQRRPSIDSFTRCRTISVASSSSSSSSSPSSSSSTFPSPAFSSSSWLELSEDETPQTLNAVGVRPLNIKRAGFSQRPRRGSVSVDMGTPLQRRSHVRRPSKSPDGVPQRLSISSVHSTADTPSQSMSPSFIVHPPSPTPTVSSFRIEPISDFPCTPHSGKRWSTINTAPIDWAMIEAQLGCLPADATSVAKVAENDASSPPPSQASAAHKRPTSTAERRRGFVGLSRPISSS